MDGVPAVLHQLHGVDSVPGEREAVGAVGMKWIMIAVGVVGVIASFLPPVNGLLPAGMQPSAVATTVLMIPAFYFVIGKLFPGEQLDVLAVTSAEVGRCVLHDCAGDGADLGASGVGDLVGAGRYPVDVDASAVADLCELPGAAALLE